MKFLIERTSLWGDMKDVDDLTKITDFKELSREDIEIEVSGEKNEKEFVTIEISDLDELVEFKDYVDCEIAIGNDFFVNDYDKIEIIDDYRG
jgi:hypothetical protein